MKQNAEPFRDAIRTVGVFRDTAERQTERGRARVLAALFTRGTPVSLTLQTGDTFGDTKCIVGFSRTATLTDPTRRPGIKILTGEGLACGRAAILLIVGTRRVD